MDEFLKTNTEDEQGETKLDKEKERINKIDIKKDLAEEHKPKLDNISSHALYFDDKLLEGLLTNKLGYGVIIWIEIIVYNLLSL
jgi:hypothetical protein